MAVRGCLSSVLYGFSEHRTPNTESDALARHKVVALKGLIAQIPYGAFALANDRDSDIFVLLGFDKCLGSSSIRYEPT